ncbi:prepilin peptidase [Aestuariimicrobium sp. Y1814]|uniref:prepilin peptidase n=1 Tax=Aestuariimicrobium sp. Y1814 TaxID=3418742 RepID=UPI003DA73B4E
METTDWHLLLWPGLGTGLLGAVLALLVARFVVPRLPEPELEDDYAKPLYRDLLHPRAIVGSIVLGFCAALVAPQAGSMMWAAVALAAAGAALVVVDAHTTYLPARLHWLTVALVMLGGLLGVTLGEPPGRWLVFALGALFGAVAGYALFWVVWRFGDGFGYGDVRLAGLVGGFAGAMGIQPWWQSLLASAVIGAVLGIGVALWRRRRPSPLGSAFPYGPALWAGPFVALWIGLVP